ncbi:hypothetical protein BSK60_33010, partial [Paenibacillus odorifer]
AQDPDEGEILYCYTNAGTDAEYIPAVGGSNVIEKTIDCIVVIGTASNVSATIDDSLVFTRESEFNAKFDASGGHKHTGAAGDGPKLTAASLAAGAATDTVIGDRTADPAIATAYGLKGSITQWFSWITKYLKAITGKANPFDTPDITLAATKTHVDDTTRHITASERTAWNAAESNAKNASIPKTEKGAASGVAAMDATSKVPRVNTYSSLGGAGGATNLNTLYTAGTYSVTNTATGAPEANYGQVIVHVSSGDSHDNATNWIWQMFFSTIGPTYVRRKVNEKEWSAWVPSWTGYNDAPLFMTRAIVPNSTDLNTLITNGVWDIYQPSGLTNLPPAGVTYGILFVFRASAATNYIKQELTDIITSTVYTRSRNGGTGWSAWVSTVTSDKRNIANGYAGLDANTKLLDAHIPDNISRLATRLVTDTNLNDVIGEGVYHCDSNTIAATILNMPPGIVGLAFGLRVTKTAGSVGFNQQLICYSISGVPASPRTYTRNYYNGSWTSWYELETSGSKGIANGYAGLDASVRVPRNNVYNSMGGANTIPAVDLDLVLTAGVYPISPVTLNKPSASMWGQVLVFVSGAETHNNANTWTWQMILQSSGGSHVRYKDAAAVWSAWVPLWTGNNDAPLFTTRGNISNNTDYNTLVKNGVYMIYNPTGTTNSSPVAYGILTVSATNPSDLSSSYIKQEVIEVTTGTIYSRSKYTPTSWTPWKTPETIDKKNVANGYVGLDANAAINVDKVIANKLRTGGFYRKQLGAFATTQNVANEKVDIVIPDMISGYIDIVLTGGFSYQQAFGQLRKRISVYTASPVTGQANAGTIYGMESRYVETIGYISADYAISDLFYDSSSQSYRIRISKLNAGSGNNIQVYIEGLASGNTHADNFEKATLSTISTGDTTVPAVPVRSFLKPTVFKDVVTNETMSIRSYGSNVTKYGNVASYFMGAANYVGTLKIKLPVGWTSAMMHIKITGYDYSSRGAWEITLGGYNFTTGWTMLSASVTTMNGTSLPFSSVRFAYEGGKCCILLGNTTTAWQYPSIEVTEVLASASGANTLGGSWYVDITTDESGITNALSTPIKWGNADSVGGYSAAQITQGTLSYAVTSGTAPTLVATFNPAVAALTAGLRVTIKAHAATTGPVTLNVNGLGAKS